MFIYQHTVYRFAYDRALPWAENKTKGELRIAKHILTNYAALKMFAENLCGLAGSK